MQLSKARVVQRSLNGFSLGELLACIAIIATMAAASGPALVSLTRSNHLSGAVRELTGVMEGARQYAITRNTPVWMAIADSEQQEAALNVAIVASKTGEDPLGWTDEITSISGHPDLELVGNIHRLSGVKLEASPSAPEQSTDSAQPLAPVQWDIQMGGATRRFTHALKFTPTGEIRVQTLSRAVEFIVAPLQGESTNSATFRAAGVTGRVSVTRPQ